MEGSRTHNVIKNISWSVFLQTALMLFQFVIRSFFIRYLGREYLGLSGLFTDILWILDLANLRVPESIMLSMYKPLAEKNLEKVHTLVHLIGKAYTIIMIIVMALGLAMIPLLPFFIKDPPVIPESFTIIYLFYLFHAVVTYFCSYKHSIIFADQKNYVVNIYQKVFHFLQIILQLVVLITLKNFYIFLSVQIFCTLVMNILATKKAEKMYPYIKGKSSYKLKKEEITEIVTNIKSMFIYSIGAITITGVDSIMVSSIVSIGMLGLCSNYLLIIDSLRTLIDQAMKGFTASIGNFNAEEGGESSEETFNLIFFIVFFVNAFCAINLTVSLNALITAWLGASFLLSNAIIIALALRFYTIGTQYITFTFRSTSGLLKRFRYIPLITAAVNISSSILMGHYFGVSGIFFSSSISIFFFTILPEAYLLYSCKFHKNFFVFVLRYLSYLLFMAANYLITDKLLSRFVFTGWTGFFKKAVLGALISGSIFIIVFFKNRNFRDICSRLLYIIKGNKIENK